MPTHEDTAPRDLSWLLALGTALILNVFLVVEWSTPSCLAPDDGPVWASYGTPLPWVRFSGVSSLEYSAAWPFLLLNLTILTVLTRPLFAPLARGRSRTAQQALLGLGGSAVVLSIGSLTMALAVGAFWPVRSLGTAAEPLLDHRPVGLSTDWHYACEPSPWWFDEP